MQAVPPKDRIERLADRVLAVAKALAGQGDGRTFTVDAIYDEMTDVSKQRLSDALKTLKDARRIHAIGRSKGIYEIEESFPAKRKLSLTSMTDGWRLLEIGDSYALAITPAEAAELGSYLAGDAVRFSVSEKLKSVDSAIAELRHENAGLKQRLRDVSKSVAAQGALALGAAAH
ncbi:MAG: hypothetical protein PHU77_00215 [Simplicispira sp.]|nr:hypothetical protein [Simplicispira sp.]